MKKTWRWAGSLLCAGIIFLWFCSSGMQNLSVRSDTGIRDRQIKVIAHRGGAAYAPENTLAALRLSCALGADMAEIDLRMTKDGVPIALHDETLARTAGSEQPACELDCQTIQSLDAGIWFSSDYTGETIPTLAEVLNFSKGAIPLMLEVKAGQSDSSFLERVIGLVQSAGMEESCLLACGDLRLLAQGKKLAPNLNTVYIGSNTWPELWSLDYIDRYSICITSLTAQDVIDAHENGHELYAWTVNSLYDMIRALTLGVDGLVTDRPATALALLNR